MFQSGLLRDHHRDTRRPASQLLRRLLSRRWASARQPNEGRMDARLQRKLRLLTVVVVTSVIAGIAFSLALGFTSPSGIEVGILYGLPQCHDRGHFAVRPRRSDAWLARESFVYSQSDGA